MSNTLSFRHFTSQVTINHFPPGGIHVHAMAVVDKEADGINHDPSHAVGSSDEPCSYPIVAV